MSAPPLSERNRIEIQGFASFIVRSVAGGGFQTKRGEYVRLGYAFGVVRAVHGNGCGWPNIAVLCIHRR